MKVYSSLWLEGDDILFVYCLIKAVFNLPYNHQTHVIHHLIHGNLHAVL